ncbi:hypothetical protein GTA08_BOTSDO09364 [Neofusicoccum parvum]|uniref:Uncharacterized protein n=2 Tax=Neofusicoccum parvum TaxID=310453 RepID=A0ACB5RQT6_9PEZI|nr:putative r3h domain protein [Neofusicoccum parvum UCRNP2]GME22893.1 hypothetical protein GTA08_BOTSDO09364 [Neofusicoccum parvum]GME45790.1 hypothetical protein GTA08_BOTSDO09364 [Neofusicoccum parvum]
MSNHPHDMYYDNPSSRSPGSQRHQPQTLHRQPSRQFDAYGQLSQQGLYTPEDHQARYDQGRYNDRLNATIHAGYGGYELGGAQAWNANAFGQNNSLAAINATTRMKPQTRGRSALPQTWLDQPQQQLPSLNTFSGLGGASLGSGQNMGQGIGQGIGQPQMRQDPYGPQEGDEELIPTAIVIKNIPFAVKKEQLVQLMTDLRLPLPYAFNYHFDNGVFRGLAFANFTTAEETAVVIETMNHFELQGRKLRVEYKKMLPLAERERIEREKRERRGQLEEQHRPMAASQLQSQPSLSSMSSHVPPATSPSPVNEVDMNDPQVLQFYSQLLLFKEDPNRDVLVFPSTLTPSQRRVCHTIAHQMGLSHNSKGMGDQRQDYGTSSTNPSLTPTATSMANRDDSLLVNGLSGMSLGGGFGQGGSPRGLRGMVSWESDRNPGPIGGHRSFSSNYDGEQSRDRSQGLPTRQPRGPIPERGSGFSRGRQNGHHGRGSDELSSQSGVEIVVE